MRFLVPVDGSAQSINAVKFLAERHVIGRGDNVELVNVQKRLPPSIENYLGREAVAQYYGEESETVRRQLDDAQKADGFEPVYKVLFGDPIDAVAAEAEVFQPDLIIIGARGQRAFTGLLFGSVSRGILARTKVPVLILRDRVPAVGRPLRIGLACDGSDISLRAVRHAVGNRQIYGQAAEWHLIHVGSSQSPEEDFEKQTAAAQAELQKAGILPKRSALTGNPGSAVAKYVDQTEIDLLIMGSHGYGNVKTLLLGSVAAKIAAESDVPLLIIR